jgi:hypothetical protein
MISSRQSGVFDDINIELHRTLRELTARAEAKVRSGQLGLAFEGLALGEHAQEGGDPQQRGEG